ncbi:hypothetical protein F2P81_004187 [Scophthalmus maximus]|uniref:Uncharacterized protein n=1 Tax=Scophthalmus maximus TaxID=52904 RepID=A0A6A4TGF7_SCOMX|nr:hypothetical protein F2P81_004187 [Scophthalmus maximus]
MDQNTKTKENNIDLTELMSIIARISQVSWTIQMQAYREHCGNDRCHYESDCRAADNTTRRVALLYFMTLMVDVIPGCPYNSDVYFAHFPRYLLLTGRNITIDSRDVAHDWSDGTVPWLTGPVGVVKPRSAFRAAAATSADDGAAARVSLPTHSSRARRAAAMRRTSGTTETACTRRRTVNDTATGECSRVQLNCRVNHNGPSITTPKAPKNQTWECFFKASDLKSTPRRKLCGGRFSPARVETFGHDAMSPKANRQLDFPWRQRHRQENGRMRTGKHERVF